jgi:predicted transcriptional regulator
MQKLAKREEQIMQACWQLGNAFIKEIIGELPDPKPHYNSVATMVRILEEKGFLDHESFGNHSATSRLFQRKITRSMR